MGKTPDAARLFSVTVVEHQGRYLLVQERKFDQTWYLPAGRVEDSECFACAAVRETREEAGIEVRLTGVLAVEHVVAPDRRKLRAVFVAEPAGDPTPKSTADEHSLQARWVLPDEVGNLPLRCDDAKSLIRRIAGGAGVHSLGVLPCHCKP